MVEEPKQPVRASEQIHCREIDVLLIEEKVP
jgi:hypothetical protein